MSNNKAIQTERQDRTNKISLYNPHYSDSFNDFATPDYKVIHPAITQLRAIGYKVGDRVTVRCIPKDTEKSAINLEGELTETNLDLWTLCVTGKDDNNKPIWERDRHREDGLSFLHSINNVHGHGIYFNVNGGRSNAEVKGIKVCIFEFDFGTFEAQREKIKTFGIDPTTVINTNGKSLQGYFVIHPEDAEKFEQWKLTQQIIALSTASDPALKDYTRLLRLAGFKHQKTGKPAKIEQLNPDAIYSLKEIQDSFNKRYSYSEKRFDLYQYLTGLQTSNKYDFGVDATIVYDIAESKLALELERYRTYKKLFTENQFEEAKAILTATYKELESYRKDRKKSERKIDANLSVIPNKTEFTSIYPYFASKYATGFHDNGGDFYKCRCPVHEGNSDDSLHLHKFSDFIKCHAGCKAKDVERELRNRAIAANDSLANNKFGKAEKETDKIQVDHKIKQEGFDGVVIPEEANVIGLWGEKGTRKTSFLKSEIIPKAKAENRAILGIVHRIELANALAKVFGISFVEKYDKNDKHPQFTLCINSLHPYSRVGFSEDILEKFTGAYLILDEVTQMLWEVLNGDLMANNRALILHCLRILINHILKTGGKCFLSDADLDQYTLDFIKGCCDDSENFKPYVIRNAYKPQRERGTKAFIFADPTPKGWFTAVDKCWGKGLKTFNFLTAQKIDKDYGTQTIEAYQRHHYPEMKPLTADGKTVHDKNHHAYQFASHYNSDPNFLYKFGALNNSPVNETGVSFDDPFHYYDIVSGCYQGQQSPNTVSQSGARLRTNATRLFWINPYSNTRIGNGSTDPMELAQDQEKKAKDVIYSLTQANLLGNDDIEAISSENIFLKTWAKMGARLNEQYKDYYVECCDRLRKEGYKVEIVEGEDLLSEDSIIAEELGLAEGETFSDGEEVKNDLTEMKELNKEDYYQKIASMSNPSDDYYNKLRNQINLTSEERDEKYRGFLERFYGIAPTEKLIKADYEDRFSYQMTLYYLLTSGSEFIGYKDAKTLKGMVSSMNEEGSKKHNQVMPHDVVRKTKTLKVEDLEEAGVGMFLNAPEDKTWSIEDEVLVAWFEAWEEDRERFKELTGINISDKSKPINVANQLLKKIDCALVIEKQTKGEDGKRERIYKLNKSKTLEDDVKREILTHWYEGDAEKFLGIPKPEKGLEGFSQAHSFTKDFLKERGLEGEQMLEEAIAFFNNPEIGFQVKQKEIKRRNSEYKEQERCHRTKENRNVMFDDVVPFITDLNPLNPLTPLVLKEYFAMLPHHVSARKTSLYPLFVTKRTQPEPEPKPEPKSEPKPEPKPETKPEPKSEPQPEPQPKPQPHPDSKPQLQPEPEPEPQISLRPYTPPQEKWAVDEETFKMFEKRHEKDPLIDKDCVEKVRFAQDKEEDDPKIWWDILEIGKSNIQLKNRVTGETCRVLSYPCSFVSKDDIALYKVGDGVALNNENPQYFEVIEVDSDANQLVLSSTEDVKIFVTPRECLKVTWDAPS